MNEQIPMENEIETIDLSQLLQDEHIGSIKDDILADVDNRLDTLTARVDALQEEALSKFDGSTDFIQKFIDKINVIQVKPGPKGDRGERGPAGMTGPKGEKGPAGTVMTPDDIVKAVNEVGGIKYESIEGRLDPEEVITKAVSRSAAVRSFLFEIADVDLSTAPTNGQVLTWDSTLQRWKAGTGGGGGGAVSSVFGRTGAVVAQANDYAVADINGLTAALTGKENTITAGTTTQYYRGDKTFQTLNGAAVANTPAGTIAATDVQAAINELDTEKGGLATANTWSGANDFTTGTITVPLATLGSQAVNKDQLDAAVLGTKYKEAVAAASTGNLTLSGTQTVDGVALVAGNRILVKDQTDQTQNGIYVVAAGAWSRSADADTGSELENASVFVSDGTMNGDTLWTCSTSPITIGVTNIQFVKIGPFVGVSSLGAVGSTPNANAGTITGSILNLEPASASFGGVVSTAAQTFAGAKAFSGGINSSRITKRVLALSANSATPAINTDQYDVVHITAQTAAITSFTTNLTGTPVDGDTLRISITGTASVALTWGTSFEDGGVVLPTTTTSTTRLDVAFYWNTETSKWRCMSASNATNLLTSANTWTANNDFDVGIGRKLTTVAYSATPTINWTTSADQVITLTGNITAITFTAPTLTSGYLKRLTLRINQDATGGRTVTGFPAAVKFAGGTAPTITATANKADVITFDYNGTDYVAVASQNF